MGSSAVIGPTRVYRHEAHRLFVLAGAGVHNLLQSAYLLVEDQQSAQAEGRTARGPAPVAPSTILAPRPTADHEQAPVVRSRQTPPDGASQLRSFTSAGVPGGRACDTAARMACGIRFKNHEQPYGGRCASSARPPRCGHGVLLTLDESTSHRRNQLDFVPELILAATNSERSQRPPLPPRRAAERRENRALSRGSTFCGMRRIRLPSHQCTWKLCFARSIGR